LIGTASNRVSSSVSRRALIVEHQEHGRHEITITRALGFMSKYLIQWHFVPEEGVPTPSSGDRNKIGSICGGHNGDSHFSSLNTFVMQSYRQLLDRNMTALR
jgi:hypothetical protein